MHTDLQTRFIAFARTEIAPHAARLGRENAFPADLFQKLGAANLLGLVADPGHGGHGGDLSWIQKGGELLTRHGGNLGIALTWMIHELVTGYLLIPHATASLRDQWLPRLISGSSTVCFAVSEPKVGPHPKKLTTRVEAMDTDYCVNGSKTYLTNGPIADLFVVIAVSAFRDGKKSYSAIAIPAETKGFTRHDALEVPFFKPSPHGGASFENCTLSKHHLIGAPHTAYADLVMTFREIEDAAMMGPVIGALAFQIAQLHQVLKDRSDLPADTCLHLGEIDARIQVMRSIAATSAVQTLSIDAGAPSPTALLCVFRELSGICREALGALVSDTGADTGPVSAILHNDLTRSSGLTRHALEAKLVRMGKTARSTN